jgi:dipeptidyl aminopeptidase/acylaminoacyl peptidase
MRGFHSAHDEPAAKQRPILPEDLWRLQRVGMPSLAPDGKWCVVEVTRYDVAKDESFSELWLLATDGSQQKQLTRSGGKNGSPTWSPTGRQIAFISKRSGDEQPQIYLIDPSGGEAHRLTRLPFAPSGLKWSADGKQLFFIAWTWPDAADDAAHKAKEQALRESKVKAYVIDEAAYRYWDHWIADGKRPQVFAVDVATGQHRNLLAGTGRCLPPYQPSGKDYDVAPDGKELCFVAENVKEIGMDQNHDLYTLRIGSTGAGSELKNLTTDNPANDTHPVYSPDGKHLAFLRQKTKFFYADQTDLMLLDRATNEIKPAVMQLERSVSNPSFVGKGDLMLFEVERDGFHMGFMTATTGNLAGVPVPLTLGPSDRGLVAAADGARVVFIRSSFNLPPTVMVQDLAGTSGGEQAARPLSHFNDELVAQWQLGRVENTKLKGWEGHEVQTFIVYPPNFDPKKKWPLVQMVHGGPHNAMTHDWSFRWNPQVWAARGYVVAIVNFHGSSGFGQAFADSITGDYGTKPLADIIKTTEWFAAQPWIDKNRLAAAGGSYGGYMMAYLNGHTDLFKAMICHAGVYSYASQMASDIVISRKRALGGFPWDNYEKMDKQSANRFAQNFKTPTLVIHGEKDYRVPITQGLEYYNTLKMKGVPARLLYFPDENHWILKPQNSLLWHKEVFGWLERYIGRGPSE